MTGRKVHDRESESSGNSKRIFDLFEPLTCKQCNKFFEKKTLLHAHVKTHQFDDHTYEAKTKSVEKLRQHICNICDKKFTVKKNLLRHLRVIHKNLNEAEKLQVKKTRCPEANCLFICRKMRDLRNHIEKYHEIKILKDTLQFANEAGFLKWKKEEEDSSVSSFVSFKRKGILRNGTMKKVLFCHRTGHYNPKGTGKHRLKSHGSCKIGGTCPAAMEITQSTDGQITVIYYKTHLGHSQDVIHLQLTTEDRARLSERINQGFSFDSILEEVKESIDPVTGKTKRIHFLSRKDLYNIIHSRSNKGFKTKNLEISRDEVKGEKVEKKQQDSLRLLGQEQVERESVGDQPPKNDECVSATIGEAPEALKSTSAPQRVVIVTPDTGVTPAPDVASHQSNTDPVDRESQRRTMSPLSVQLKEKIDKIYRCLPKCEYLTPRQYEAINKKLDGILNAFSTINVKAKSKKSKKVGVDKGKDDGVVVDGAIAAPTNTEGIGYGCLVTVPQDIQHQVYETPLYAYLCNYNSDGQLWAPGWEIHSVQQ